MGIKRRGMGRNPMVIVDGKMREDRFSRWQEQGKTKDAFLPMKKFG